MSRSLLAHLQADAPCTLWLDGTDYCARLLAGGNVPWLDVAAGVAWLRKSQDLLRSDVVTIDVMRIAEAACAARPAMRQAMAAKSRGGYALKVMLADEELRRLLVEWIVAARAALPQWPLCLRLPSPRHAIGEAWRLGHGDAASTEPDEDQIDAAALYLADFLRAFSAAGVDALLLSEGAGAAPDAATQELYQSVFNVAAGYQWAVGLECPPGVVDIPVHAGFAFAVADTVLNVPTALRVPEAFWSDAAAAPQAGLRHAQVPATMQPERVLERLAQLRG